jgi:hypothetical protein
MGVVGMIWKQCPYRYALIFLFLSREEKGEGLLAIGRTF